jgi:predicted protein tyrosine phosphatase
MRNVLFVCTANLQRSPTAEDIFQGWKGIWETKSAGIMPDPDGNSLSQELIDWADVIIVMERMHSQFIQANFQHTTDKIQVLNIPDRYFRGDPQLRRELYKRVPAILEKYSATERARKRTGTQLG